jgi:UDP-N-acetylmuramoylalanine--D-glutamate ligase
MIDKIIQESSEVLVIGCGKSGIEAAKLLKSLDKNILLYDDNYDEDKNVKTFDAINIEATNNLDLINKMVELKEFDLVVTSPGIPKAHILHSTAQENNILIVSELELAFQFCKRPIIAITGSNGKSTTTKLISEIINNSGKEAIPCGNYGTPLAAFVLQEHQPDYYVAEVSSFQLEWIHDFKPKVGIILNVQADHLDRHGTINEYASTKKLLFKNMDSSELAIAFKKTLDDFNDISTDAKVTVFTDSKTNDSEFHYLNNSIYQGTKKCISISNSYFDNKVLSLNAIAAYIATSFFKIDKEIIKETILNFKSLSHRTEFVRKIDNRIFIDDSKATNLASLEAALNTFGTKKNIILIAGGILKEKKLDYTKDLLDKFVKKIYLIGNDGNVMLDAWKDIVSCEYKKTLENAAKSAFQESESGDIILLSPACASFDQFSGYKERGQVFQKLANSF